MTGTWAQKSTLKGAKNRDVEKLAEVSILVELGTKVTTQPISQLEVVARCSGLVVKSR